MANIEIKFRDTPALTTCLFKRREVSNLWPQDDNHGAGRDILFKKAQLKMGDFHVVIYIISPLQTPLKKKKNNHITAHTLHPSLHISHLDFLE